MTQLVQLVAGAWFGAIFLFVRGAAWCPTPVLLEFRYLHVLLESLRCPQKATLSPDSCLQRRGHAKPDSKMAVWREVSGVWVSIIFACSNLGSLLALLSFQDRPPLESFCVLEWHLSGIATVPAAACPNRRRHGSSCCLGPQWQLQIRQTSGCKSGSAI